LQGDWPDDQSRAGKNGLPGRQRNKDSVKSFPLMTKAYAQGAMAFGLFVAKKCRSN
jgi:hypothetical protein